MSVVIRTYVENLLTVDILRHLLMNILKKKQVSTATFQERMRGMAGSVDIA